MNKFSPSAVWITILLIASIVFPSGANDDEFVVERSVNKGYTWAEQKGLSSTSDDRTTCFINLRGYSQKGMVPVIYIRFIDLYNEGENKIKKLSDIALKGKDGSITTNVQIKLSNGEILTTNKAVLSDNRNAGWDFAGICSLHLSAGELSSSRENLQDYKYNEDQAGYIFDRLKNYNITSVTVDGKTIQTPNLQSSRLYREIIPILVAASGATFEKSANPEKKSGATTPPPAVKSYTTPSSSINGNVEKVWVDHNVFQNNQKGMRIHVKFNVNNMKGKTGRICAYFCYSNGSPLKGNNYTYMTPEKNVTVQTSFTPNYENCVYNDAVLFLPYSALNMAKGKYNLKFYIQIFEYTNGARNFAQSSDVFFDFTL